MGRARLALVAAGLSIALSAGAETLEVAGTIGVQKRIDRYLEVIEGGSGVELSISSVGGGKALLDLVEGKVAVVAISGGLDDAIAAAKRQAAAEGKTFVLPSTLKLYKLARAAGEEHPVGFITNGDPGASMQKVLKYFRSRHGRMVMLAAR